MGEVVELKGPPEPEYCMICSCGSQDFILLFGGLVQCSECRYISSIAVWQHIPPEIR